MCPKSLPVQEGGRSQAQRCDNEDQRSERFTAGFEGGGKGTNQGMWAASKAGKGEEWTLP